MYLETVHYYFLKKLINALPENISSAITLDDKKLFYYANMLSMDKYFNSFSLRRDKSKLGEKINNDFNTFYTNLLITLSEKNSVDLLIFAYSILSYKILDDYIMQYINIFKPYKMNIFTAKNMLDSYVFKKLYDKDLYKTSYYKQFGNFIYDIDIDKIMKPSFIKSYKVTAFSPYYERCNKKRNRVFKSSKNIIVRLLVIFLDIFRKNKRYKNYYFKKKFDNNLLNLDHNEYTINEQKLNYTFEELLDYLTTIMLDNTKMINDYLVDGNEKEIRKYLDIPLDKKL